MFLTVLITTWVISGVVSYGLTFHYFTERYKCFAYPARARHRIAAMASVLMGPFGLLQRWVFDRWDRSMNQSRTSWRLRYFTPSAEESYADFRQRWPNLSRKEWLNS